MGGVGAGPPIYFLEGDTKLRNVSDIANLYSIFSDIEGPSLPLPDRC